MKKKLLIGTSIVLVAGASFYGYRTMTDKKNRQKAVDSFVSDLKKQNFDDYSQLFSKKSLEDYTLTNKAVKERYETIFGSIGVTKVKVTNLKDEKYGKKNYRLTYNLELTTPEGVIKPEKYKAIYSKSNNGKFEFKWNSHLIFPGMEATDKVSLQNDVVERGAILDRNGKSLAENKEFKQIGMNPSQLGDDKKEALKEISEAIDTPVDKLEALLEPEWTKGDVFVPIKVLDDKQAAALKDKLPRGTSLAAKKQRFYPLGKAAAHLVGYVGQPTAEDLDKNPDLDETTPIGRMGLEQALDNDLRGKNGLSLVITTAKGDVKKTVFKRKAVEGKTVKLTLDREAQQKAFDSLENKPGAIVATQPKTGDLLVATSSPSFDPNQFITGMADKEYKALSEDKHLPFLARYANRYAPGSTFKTITAAIGLDAGVIKPEEALPIDGLKWQKDKSWGGFWTTRVKEQPTVNLEQALVYSDNIYFAQQALKMGEKTLMDGLAKFPFNKEMTLPIPMEPASISNEKEFKNDILLADTAYGQGQLMITPLQQLEMYSVFMNEGNLITPKLIEDAKTEKTDGIVSDKSAKIVLDDLVGTVANEDGYAHNLYQPGFNLAAKTGTAEIKEKQDTVGTENSFLLFLDKDKSQFMGLVFSEDSRKNGAANEKAKVLVDYLEKNYN